MRIATNAAAMTRMSARGSASGSGRPDRPGGRPADPGGGVRPRRGSRDLRLRSGRAVQEGRHRRRRAGARGGALRGVLAARRYELVDPAKRHVARELEARWNDALERVASLERRVEELSAQSAARPGIDRARLLQLAHDLPAAWNASSTDTGAKQRLIHILVQEIVCELDDATNEAALLIHWTGGRHSELRVPRVKTGRYPTDMAPAAADALRKLAGHWPDRELAVSLNRMRCKSGDGETWTTVRVRDMRERLGIAEFDPAKADAEMISLTKAAERLGICVGSAKSLALKGILPATQILPGSPWLVPVDALTSEAVRIGVQRVVERRPKFYEYYQYDKLIRLPGL